MTSERDADDADVQKQRESVDADEDSGAPLPHDAEVPEADALEQRASIASDGARLTPLRRPDVPEADALDQSIEVPLDDDDDR
jgi:hypothetical protein